MTTKEKIYSLLAALAAIGIVSAIVFAALHPNITTPTSGGGFSHGFCDTNGNSGTSSPLVYQYTTAASTTLPCFTDIADQVDVQLYVVSSSTASTVSFNVQYSNDNVTWFNLETPLAVPVGTSGVILFATSTNQYTWTPGTTATSTLDFPLTAVNSKYTRLNIGMFSAGYGLYARLINKNVSRN